MSWQKIPIQEKSDWNKILEKIPHNFFHTWEYNSAHSLSDKDSYARFLVYIEDAEKQFVIPILERKFKNYIDISTPYGMSGFSDSLYQLPENEWLDFVHSNDYVCSYLALNPFCQIKQKISAPDNIIQSHSDSLNDTFYFDLSLDMSRLYQNLSRHHQRDLKKWQKNDCKICAEQNTLTTAFLDMYYPFIKRVRANSVYFFNRKTLIELINSEHTFLIGATRKGKIEAVSLFSFYHGMGDFLLTASTLEGSQHSKAIIYSALEKMHGIGGHYFNLGGGISKNDSLALFKQRFGTHQKPINAIKTIYKKQIYRELCGNNRKTSYFPAYRQAENSDFSNEETA